MATRGSIGFGSVFLRRWRVLFQLSSARALAIHTALTSARSTSLAGGSGGRSGTSFSRSCWVTLRLEGIAFSQAIGRGVVGDAGGVHHSSEGGSGAGALVVVREYRVSDRRVGLVLRLLRMWGMWL